MRRLGKYFELGSCGTLDTDLTGTNKYRRFMISTREDAHLRTLNSAWDRGKAGLPVIEGLHLVPWRYVWLVPTRTTTRRQIFEKTVGLFERRVWENGSAYNERPAFRLLPLVILERRDHHARRKNH